MPKPSDSSSSSSETVEESSSSSSSSSSSLAPIPTAEDLERTRQTMMASQGWGDHPEGERSSSSSSEPEPSSSSSSSSAVQSSSSSSSQKKKAANKPAPRVETDEEMVERLVTPAAERIAEKIASALPSSSSAAAPAAPQLDDKARAQLAAFKVMEEKFPENKGLADRVQKFWTEETRYISDWERANQGKSFDEKDEEHQDWYAKHSPTYDEDQLDEAKLEMRVKPQIEQATRKLKADQDKELGTLRFKEQLRETEAKRNLLEHESLVMLVDKATPELAKHLEVDGKKRVTPETAKKIEEADPVAYELLNEEGEKLRIETSELAKLSEFPQHYALNPNLEVKLLNGESHHPHREIVQFAVALEDELSTAPVEETERNGKKFMLQQDFNERANRIATSDLSDARKDAAMRTLKASYWTLGPKDLAEALVHRHSERVTKQLDRINKLSERKNKSSGSSSSSAPASTKTDEQEPTPGSRKKPDSPSTATSSDKGNNGNSNNSSGVLTREEFESKMFG